LRRGIVFGNALQIDDARINAFVRYISTNLL